MFSFSYYKLKTYQSCPRQFFSKYIAENPSVLNFTEEEAEAIAPPYPDEGENFYFMKGSRLHSQIEHVARAYVNTGQANFQPNSDFCVAETFNVIKPLLNSSGEKLFEHRLAVNEKFEPISWGDADKFYRCIIDFAVLNPPHALIADYKSGKVYEYSDELLSQANLMAMVVMSHFPELEYIRTGYIFMEHGPATSFVTVDPDKCREVQKALVDLTNTILSDREFKPKKFEYCKYCKVKSSCSL